MPDISMCQNNACKDRKPCVRHQDSGTKPSDYQCWAEFQPDENGHCDGYWHNKQQTLWEE